MSPSYSQPRRLAKLTNNIMVVAVRFGKKAVARSGKKGKSADFTVTFTNGVCELGIVYVYLFKPNNRMPILIAIKSYLLLLKV
jgi:hypothetical protein